jgi:hypothetical protein
VLYICAERGRNGQGVKGIKGGGMARGSRGEMASNCSGVEGGPDRWGRLISLIGGLHPSLGGGKKKGVPVRLDPGWAVGQNRSWA